MGRRTYLCMCVWRERATAGARGGAIPRERGQEVDSQMEGEGCRSISHFCYRMLRMKSAIIL